MTALVDLQSRLDLLPRELYDYIFNLVFLPTNSRTTIDTDYKPPSNLQVNHTTRKTAATQYFTLSEFHFTDHNLCMKWLLSQSNDHLMLLQSVYCESVSESQGGLDLFNHEARMHRERVVYRLRERGVELRRDVLKFAISGRGEGECKAQ